MGDQSEKVSLREESWGGSRFFLVSAGKCKLPSIMRQNPEDSICAGTLIEKATAARCPWENL